MSDNKIRTRLAPSPTGDPHVGTAYQALFGYVFAKSNNGKFILRIEDTDRERSSETSEKAILDSIKWLGLQWDEGPDVGGEFGPYRQSERLDIYHEHLDILVKKEHAYPCFCTKERLAEVKKERQKEGLRGYDRHCRDIPAKEAAKRIDAGELFTVRMKVPVSGTCVFEDYLRGTIEIDWEHIDDQVILKADGFPTYHLAVVVDDHLMEISHIIRGEEWINSVPKHILLYEYFGWELPVFCHMPLLRNKDKSKLSKRKNPTSVDYYKKIGILPEALLNFLGMLGWHLSDEKEKFTIKDMIENFKLEDINLGGPVFDVDKLHWLNGRYIRENYTPEQFAQLLINWGLNADTFSNIAELCIGRMTSLSDWGEMTSHFFSDRVLYNNREDLLFPEKSEGESAEYFQMIIWKMEDIEVFDKDAIRNMFDTIAKALNLKLRQLLLPCYAAVSGEKVSTPLFESMVILGSDMTRMRLKYAIEELGGLGKKKLKKLDNRYSSLF